MTLKEIDRIPLTTEDYERIWNRTYNTASAHNSFTDREGIYQREVRLAKVRKAREIRTAHNRNKGRAAKCA